MTDQELIKALRKTATVITAEMIAWDDLKIAAADRLEALLADLVHSSNAIDFDTSVKLAKWLTDNGVTFREG